MGNIFIHTDDQLSFEKKGYATLDILDDSEISQIRSYYEQLKSRLSIKNSVYGIYVSLDDKDSKLKRDTMQFIQSLVQPKLNNYLQGYKTHLGGFIIKQPDNYSYTYPHQDWTFVPHNEKESFSATIWISIDTLSPEMGSLGFIEGSHRFFEGIIGSPSSYLINSTQGHEELLFNYLQFPEIKAGQGFIFNNKCIHGANPNTTNSERIIVGIGITPKTTPLTHYYLKPKTTNKILQLEVPEDFFLTYMNQDLIDAFEQGKIPENCKIIRELQHENTRYTEQEIIELLDKNGCKIGKYSISKPQVTITPTVEKTIEVNKNRRIDYFRNLIPKAQKFFSVYTPYNVYKESKFRLTGKY